MFLTGARAYINHYAFLSFGVGPRGGIGSVLGIRKRIAALGIANDLLKPLDSIVDATAALGREPNS